LTWEGVRLDIRISKKEDEPFLYALYAETRQDEMIAWGLHPDESEPFLRMQFNLQQQSYAMQYRRADPFIVMEDETPIGQIRVYRSEMEIIVVDISIIQAYRNAGRGTGLIRGLQEEARIGGRTLRLSVLEGNKARRLYERLGFAIRERQSPYLLMEWR
jgi:GNAT superfamily N-acetyltransferase